jgi:hypothetical protein
MENASLYSLVYDHMQPQKPCPAVKAGKKDPLPTLSPHH